LVAALEITGVAFGFLASVSSRDKYRYLRQVL